MVWIQEFQFKGEPLGLGRCTGRELFGQLNSFYHFISINHQNGVDIKE